ncbi:hypothetical protein D9M68_810350 [compost metagenome]
MMAQHNGPGIDAVIAINHLEDRALARSRWPAEHYAFAGFDVKIHIIHHRQNHAIAQVHGEGLGEVLY